jgi:hypothetical protein
MNRDTEVGSEATDCRSPERSDSRHLESLDDIVREIADRRINAEFGDFIPPERVQTLRDVPDELETGEAFDRSAEKAGLGNTTGVLGWSTHLEAPAHVLKGEVPVEVATLVHEDLHRLTHAETLREFTATPELRNLYEGVTECLTEQAVHDLHEHKSGECYPEQMQEAKRLSEIVGESDLRRYYFDHEVSNEVRQAIERLERERSSN